MLWRKSKSAMSADIATRKRLGARLKRCKSKLIVSAVAASFSTANLKNGSDCELAYKIVIDAGHGYAADTGGDPGAVNGKYYESVATLAIAKKLKTRLVENGYKVKMTRTGGEKDLSLAERCEIANDWGADCFVSIHLNAAANKDAKGAETWRYANVGTTTKRLADNVQKQLIAATGAVNRGVKTTTAFYVLKKTKCPAVLCEVGFISNDAEAKKLFSSTYQNKIADGLLKGIRNTLK